MQSYIRAGRAIAGAGILAFATTAPAQHVTSSDVYAPHVSTLAANAGQNVALHVHRKVALAGYSPEVLSVVRLGSAALLFRCLGGPGRRRFIATGRHRGRTANGCPDVSRWRRSGRTAFALNRHQGGALATGTERCGPRS